MAETQQDRNKAFVLEAYDTLFNKRDYEKAEMYWSEDYIQHSSFISPGRDGLFSLVKSAPDVRHEVGFAFAEGDMVMLHGRFSGPDLPAPWVVADIVRLENGVLKEHWDVREDEAPRGASLSGLPMFGDAFPEER